MSPPIPITFENLSKAYLPTLGRDIVYGMSRNAVAAFVKAKYPGLDKSAGGQFLAMFITALASCIISSPFNELRGYTLQPPSRKKSFGEFFKPNKYVRSTAVGATNLALALGTGRLVVEPVKAFLAKFRANVPPIVIMAAAITIYLRRQRNTKAPVKEGSDSGGSESWKKRDALGSPVYLRTLSWLNINRCDANYDIMTLTCKRCWRFHPVHVKDWLRFHSILGEYVLPLFFLLVTFLMWIIFSFYERYCDIYSNKLE